MAIDVFGHGMDDYVGAVIERVLDVWTQECVIHHNKDAVLMRD